MAHDLEFLRHLLFYLEDRQVSPRATIIIDIPADADALDCDARQLEECLNLLLELDYIEGPGAEGGLWLFRKLSRKGIRFTEAARRPEDWEQLKRRYALAFAPHTP